MKQVILSLAAIAIVGMAFQNCGSSNSGSGEFGENVSSLVNHQGPLSEEQIEQLSLDCETEVEAETQFPERGCFQFIFGEPEASQQGTVIDVEGFDVQDLIDLAVELFANVEEAPEIIILINGETTTDRLDLSQGNFNIYLTGGTLNVGPSSKPVVTPQKTLFLKGGRLN